MALYFAKNCANIHEDSLEEVAIHALNKFKHHVIPFDEAVRYKLMNATEFHISILQDYLIREALFSHFIKNEMVAYNTRNIEYHFFFQFREAAQYLAGVNLEGTTKTFTDSEKADLYIRCAEAFLMVRVGASRASSTIRELQLNHS